MPERVAAEPAKAGLNEDEAGTEGGVIEGPVPGLKMAVVCAPERGTHKAQTTRPCPRRPLRPVSGQAGDVRACGNRKSPGPPLSGPYSTASISPAANSRPRSS